MRSLLFLVLLLSTHPPAYGSCNKNYTAPHFTDQDFLSPYPEKIAALLGLVPKEESERIANECAADPEFEDSMERLEYAVAQAAIHDPQTQQQMTEVARKTYATLIAVARIHKEWVEEHSEYKINMNSYVAELLETYYGNCHQTVTGCVGQNAKAIQDSFFNGNMREQLYLINTSHDTFLRNELLCKEPSCICNNSVLLEKLRKLSLTDETLKSVYDSCQLDFGKSVGHLQTGTFRLANNHFRRKLGDTESLANTQVIDQYRKNHHDELRSFNENDLMIPLSFRERNFLRNQGAINPSLSNPRITYYTGETVYVPIHEKDLNFQNPNFPDPHNLYYKTAQKFAFPVVTAISGTTDALLSVGCFVGLDSQTSQERLRLGAIAAMVPHRHHTVYEIIVSSKSYGNLNMNPNMDYYKYLVKDDPSFANEVEREYSRASSLLPNRHLPTDIFAECVRDNLPINVVNIKKIQKQIQETSCHTEIQNSKKLESEVYQSVPFDALQQAVGFFLWKN